MARCGEVQLRPQPANDGTRLVLLSPLEWGYLRTFQPHAETGGVEAHRCLSAPIVKVRVLLEVAEPTFRPKELSGKLHLGLTCDVSV